MDTKIYPKKGLTAVSMSSCVTCAKCKQPSGVYEAIYKQDGKEVFYHIDCVSDDDKETSTEIKVHEMFLTDDLNVKSEGN